MERRRRKLIESKTGRVMVDDIAIPRVMKVYYVKEKTLAMLQWWRYKTRVWCLTVAKEPSVQSASRAFSVIFECHLMLHFSPFPSL